MVRKTQGGPLKVSSVCYILQIEDWNWSYSFGVNEPRYNGRTYGDYRHIVVRAEVLLPSKLKLKARTAELTFMPDVQLANIEQKREHRPTGVGYIDVREARLTGGFSMSADALGPVMQMLVAGRFKYIVLDGERLRYRKARIRNYRFETQIALDEYPDD
ncbi:hypothetical protein JJE66_28085 [Bradyrhizobium diazoefficiens]|uniref:hypothetical protein n=1 Tax=Bradyrhizobium diazoefficiens TaxID=1355477 RepID=UPI001909A091|nr:hypothetical protein [Bradyrhizobium diazoefficiens]MBK3665079.1 hypothetical protein [Bradyrhizobium diazoefficiens]